MKEHYIISIATIVERADMLIHIFAYIANQKWIEKISKVIINIDKHKNQQIPYNKYVVLASKYTNVTFEFNICENKWRSCNKLIYTLQKYPDANIIVFDDDTIIEQNVIYDLIKNHIKHPKCIIAENSDVTTIIHNKTNEDVEFDFVQHFTGWLLKLNAKEINYNKYGGQQVLFPAHCFDNTHLFNLDEMLKITLGTHDEIWFWLNSTLNKVQVFTSNYLYSTVYANDKYLNKNNIVRTDPQLCNENDNNWKIIIGNINIYHGIDLINVLKSNPIIFNIDDETLFNYLYNKEIIKKYYDYTSIKFKFDKKLSPSWIDFFKKEWKK